MKKKKTLIIILASTLGVIMSGIIIGLVVLIPYLMDLNHVNPEEDIVSTTESASYIQTTDDENQNTTDIKASDYISEKLHENVEVEEPVLGSFEYSHSVSKYTMEKISTQYPYNSHFYFDENGTGIVTTKISEGSSNDFLIFDFNWELYETHADINTNVYAISFEDGGVGYVFYNKDSDFCYTTDTVDNIICYYYRH
ncbi:MAG: hypothetical protein E7530_02005 [Ruminococcaceae bacterium]|nr:hypothetical protein [Oscillospiraceae bacterium]